MRISIITVGRAKQAFIQQGEQEYCTRLKPWVNLEFCELEARTSLPEVAMKREESRQALERVEKGAILVVLDERGRSMTSREFASWLSEQMVHGGSRICFAIGGAYGWDDEMRNSAQLVLSLSKMTYPYQMVRLLLLEQLYRAMTLMKGIPYHK